MTNVALSGGPLFLFILFGLTVFVFALILALVVALVIFVLFTLSALGIGLMVLFPVIFFTTLIALSLFLWGLGGYYIWKTFNQGSLPAAKGDAIGDKLNSLTGGRLDWVMGQAREAKTEEKLGPGQAEMSKGAGGNHAPAPKQIEGTPTPKKKAHANGGLDGVTGATNGVKDNVNAKGVSSGVSSAGGQVNNVTKTAGAGNVGDKVTKTAGGGDVGGAAKGGPKKLSSAGGTVKGTAGGALGGVSGLG